MSRLHLRKALGLSLLLILIARDAAGAPVFVDDPSKEGHVVISSGADFFLRCSTREPADIFYVATKSNVTYGPGNTHVNITKISDRETLLSVKSNDSEARARLFQAKFFVCEAQSTVDGTRSTTAKFEIIEGEKPSFEGQSENRQASEGQEITLFCLLSSSTLPYPLDVFWIFKNETGVFTFLSTADQSFNDRFSLKLTLSRHNHGEYRCNATNKFGSGVSGSIQVNVTYFDESHFLFNSSLNVVKEGGTVKLTVQTEAFPPPAKISIVKDGNILDSTANKNYFEVRLTAKQISSGNYTVAVQHQSNTYTRTLNLQVLSKPDGINFSVIAFYSHSFNYSWNVTFPGNPYFENVTMCCTALRGAVRNVSCSNGDSKTTPAGSGVNDTLSDLTESNTYYCQLFVTNALGSRGSKTKEVTIPTAPGRPTLRCVRAGTMHLTADFSVDSTGGDKILGYRAYYWNAGGRKQECKPVTLISANGGRCQAFNLLDDHTYFFEVIAWNSVGSNLPLLSSCNTTCGPLIGVNASSESSGLAMFKIPSRCGFVKSYSVKDCDTASTFDADMAQLDTGVSITVQGLKSGNYCLSLTVTTDQGFTQTKNFSGSIIPPQDKMWTAGKIVGLVLGLVLVLLLGLGGPVLIYSVISIKKETTSRRGHDRKETGDVSIRMRRFSGL
eukprot:m.94474 g.94474  ORF g.94474 m.94474 type:complete len:670 (+) comp36818_c1_seq1:56-2065(+)